MANLTVGNLVIVTQFRFYLNQVVDVHQRGKGLPAAATMSSFFVLPNLFVKAHTYLRWPLEDVKKFAKGQP